MIGINPYKESVNILCEGVLPTGKEYVNIVAVLEDTNSPVTKKYIEKLYDSVLSKDHIDFDNIPESKGDIRTYSGYNNMMEVLLNIERLAQEQKATNVIGYVKTVQNAIKAIENTSDLYSMGYKLKNEYVMLEYNIYTYTCIQATSTILSEFVEYIKRPDRDTIDITLKNTSQRANLFYIKELEKFNNVVSKMEYRQFLKSHLNADRENFVGTETLVGMGAVALVAMSIVPITRELVYQFYHIRSSLSDNLAQQAYFLEINKANVEANKSFTSQKKKSILDKQEKLKKRLLKISDKLRVNHAMTSEISKRSLKKDNTLLTIDKIKKDVDEGPLSLM